MAIFMRHSRRKRCAPRWRRLIVEPFEQRTLLSTAPSGADKIVTSFEDTAYVFSAADFGFSDPGDTPPNAFLLVKITTLPNSGALTENNVAVTAGQFVPVNELTAGRLRFTPA